MSNLNRDEIIKIWSTLEGIVKEQKAINERLDLLKTPANAPGTFAVSFADPMPKEEHEHRGRCVEGRIKEIIAAHNISELRFHYKR